jgi:hypothetical protein
MTQEIDLYSRIANPVEAIESLGRWFAKSGMAGCQNEAQGIVLAWECMAKRKSPSDIVAENHIVDGKLSRKALAIAARFQDLGGKIKWIKTGEDGKEAEAEYSIDGETIRTRFTIDDARKQGLLRPSSNWLKVPGNMLRARCHSNGIGMLRPGLVLGITTDDAVEGDLGEPKVLLQTSEEAKAAIVTEIKTVTRQADPATSVTQSTPTKPEPKKDIPWQCFKNPTKVSVEGVKALEDAIEKHAGEKALEVQTQVLTWLRNEKWIPAEQKDDSGKVISAGSLPDLSPKRALMIWKDVPAFLRHIEKKG